MYKRQVFVFAQQVDNVIGGIAFELIGKGKDLAKDLNTEVTACLLYTSLSNPALLWDLMLMCSMF